MYVMTPYWVGHFKFANSDNRFVISDPKSLYIPICRSFYAFIDVWPHKAAFGRTVQRDGCKAKFSIFYWSV